MYIDDENKWIYFHAGKTGGSSIREILSKYFGMSWAQHLTEYLKHRGRLELFEKWDRQYGHVFLRDLITDFPEDKQSFILSYKKWGFVRNPYTHLYSSYMQFNAYHNPNPKIYCDFNTTVELWEVGNCVWQLCHIKTVLWYEGKMYLDWVGCFERYHEDLCMILKRCNVQYDYIPHANHRGDNNYLKHYNRNSIRIVNEYNKDIFETFGYTMLDPNLFPEEVDPNNPFEPEYDDKPKYLKDGKIIPH